MWHPSFLLLSRRGSCSLSLSLSLSLSCHLDFYILTYILTFTIHQTCLPLVLHRAAGFNQEHLQELAAKEEEKRAAFMAQMGLKAGQKITIQPRRDG